MQVDAHLANVVRIVRNVEAFENVNERRKLKEISRDVGRTLGSRVADKTSLLLIVLLPLVQVIVWRMHRSVSVVCYAATADRLQILLMDRCPSCGAPTAVGRFNRQSPSSYINFCYFVRFCADMETQKNNRPTCSREDGR